MTPSKSLDRDRMEAIERLLSYADRHLRGVESSRDKDSLRYHLDHFLLTVNATAENLNDVVGWETPHSRHCELEPAFAPMVWAWVARVHVAHRYVVFLDSVGTALDGTLGGHAIGSMAMNEGFQPRLCPVYEGKGEKTPRVSVPPPPELVHEPAKLAKIVLNFWRSAYEHFSSDRDLTGSARWVDLWKRFSSPAQ